jgi:hypothetical protein
MGCGGPSVGSPQRGRTPPILSAGGTSINKLVSWFFALVVLAVVSVCFLGMYRAATLPNAKWWGLSDPVAGTLGLIGTFLVVPIWGLLDAGLHSHSTWWQARRSKPAWLLAQLMVPVAGPLAYFVGIRPQLAEGGHPSPPAGSQRSVHPVGPEGS